MTTDAGHEAGMRRLRALELSGEWRAFFVTFAKALKDWGQSVRVYNAWLKAQGWHEARPAGRLPYRLPCGCVRNLANCPVDRKRKAQRADGRPCAKESE